LVLEEKEEWPGLIGEAEHEKEEAGEVLAREVRLLTASVRNASL
jgi:hypothetical protein